MDYFQHRESCCWGFLVPAVCPALFGSGWAPDVRTFSQGALHPGGKGEHVSLKDKLSSARECGERDKCAPGELTRRMHSMNQEICFLNIGFELGFEGYMAFL